MALTGFRSLASEQIVLDNPTFWSGGTGRGKSNLADAFSFIAAAMVAPPLTVLDRRYRAVASRNSLQRSQEGLGIVRATGDVRAPGGGRKRLGARPRPGLGLGEAGGSGAAEQPRGPLPWTSLRAEKLADALRGGGARCDRTVSRMLPAMGYSLQANRKMAERRQHPDRDAQFNHINRCAPGFPAPQRSGRVGGHEEEDGGRLRQRRALAENDP